MKSRFLSLFCVRKLKFCLDLLKNLHVYSIASSSMIFGKCKQETRTLSWLSNCGLGISWVAGVSRSLSAAKWVRATGHLSIEIRAYLSKWFDN